VAVDDTDLDEVRRMLGISARFPRGRQNVCVAEDMLIFVMERLRYAGLVVKDESYTLSAHPCYRATPAGARAVGLKRLP
jgi:hypothetical protein